MKRVIGEVKAICLGSIGTIVETSELQRRAFNLAFKKCDLPWVWEEGIYKDMLVKAGGKKRIRSYADEAGFSISPEETEKVYKLKNHYFTEHMRSTTLTPRAGIRSLLNRCSEYGVKVCWVTTANKEIVYLLKDVLNSCIDFGGFELITTIEEGVEPKPAPDIYLKVVSQIGIFRDLTFAIEDSESGFTAANEAGIRCLIVPGQLKKSQQYNGSETVLESAEDIHLERTVGGRINLVVEIKKH